MTQPGHKYLELAKHTIVFGMGSMANKLLGLILLPLYTAYLTPTDYGITSILTVTSTLVSILWTAGLRTSTFKHFFDSDDAQERVRVTSTALYWIAGTGLGAVALFWLPARMWATALLDGPEGAIYFRIMGWSLFFVGIQTIPLVVLRSEKKSLQYALFSMASFVFGAGLNVYMVAFRGMGVLGTRVAHLVTSMVFAVVGLYLCRHHFRLTFSRTVAASLLRYGLPLVPAGLASYVLVQSDRYFLKVFSGLAVTGIYSIGYQFGMVLNLVVVEPLQMIWLPTAFEMQGRRDAKAFFGRILTYYLAVSSWFGLGLSLLSREVIFLMTSDHYHSAYTVVPWITYAYVAYGAYMVLNVGVYLTNHTADAWKIVGTAAVGNLALNVLLIPSLGMYGAAIATLLSYIFLAGLSWYVNRRLYPIPYEGRRLLKVLAVSGLMLAIGWLLPDGNIGLSVGLKVVVLAAYWLLLWAWRFFYPFELAYAHTLWGKLRASQRARRPAPSQEERPL